MVSKRKIYRYSKTIALPMICGALLLLSSSTRADNLLNRSLQIDNSQANSVAAYKIKFNIIDNYVLGSLVFEVCSNSPLKDIPCIAPTDFNASGASIINQSGITGFSIHPSSTSNKLIFTKTPTAVGPVSVEIELSGIVNPSTSGTHYGRLLTYSSTDGTGTNIDEGGTTFSIGNSFDIHTEVPPYLIFCVGIEIPGFDCSLASINYIDLGEFSSHTTKFGTSRMLVMTNADSGFVIYSTSVGFTAGNNIIPAMSSQLPSSIGSSQFGLNLRANTSPSVGSDPVGIGAAGVMPNYNVSNRYKFVSGETLASSSGTSAEKKFTVSYIVNINNNQPPGIYSSTFLYTATATF